MVNLKVSDLMIKIHDKLILDGINIDFKAEKKTAIIGPNGCGKSTLAKMIMNIYKPTLMEKIFCIYPEKI